MKIHQESVASFEYVCNQLLLAGWLRSFESVAEQGYVFKWTRKGLQRVFLIQRIIEEFKLRDHPANAKRFTDACQNLRPDPDQLYSSACRDFWLSCLEETSLSREENHLWAFTVIIDAEPQQEELSTAEPTCQSPEISSMAQA